MRKRKQDISVTIIILSSSLQTVLSNVPVFSNEKSYKIQNETRRERFFNLFQVVTFPNSECTGTNGDKGTCLSRSECQGQSGSISGTCAFGFGACCLVYQDTCGGTLPYNCTYFRNPGYSGSYSTGSTCTWTFPKTSSDVCQIRLEFEELTTAAPTTQGECSTDYFQATGAATGTTQGSSGNLSPRICGINTGSHIYIDAGESLASEASLTAVITQAATWKIKVKHILCSSLDLPPNGCLQYHTGVSGQVRSFNFLATDSYNHLQDQSYQVCVRREQGYCKIAWTQSDDPHSFKVSRPFNNFNSLTGQASCNEDFVTIPLGSNEGQHLNGVSACSTPAIASLATIDRYCGGTLTCIHANDQTDAGRRTIISSYIPFGLGVDFGTTENAALLNRGFCLNYYQIAC